MPDLQRFLDAQAPVYLRVLRELAQGSKHSHWMWFIFPQLAGLGSSSTAHYFGIVDMAHAQAYIGHAVLGARLSECVRMLNEHHGRSAEEIFGYPDYLKLHSCLTLFHAAAPQQPQFPAALEKYYDGIADPATIKLLSVLSP